MGVDIFIILTAGALFLTVMLQLSTLLILQNQTPTTASGAGSSTYIAILNAYRIIFSSIVLLLLSYGAYLMMDWIATDRYENKLTPGRVIGAGIFMAASAILIVCSIALSITGAVRVAHIPMRSAISLMSISCVISLVYLIFVVLTLIRGYSKNPTQSVSGNVNVVRY